MDHQIKLDNSIRDMLEKLLTFYDIVDVMKSNKIEVMEKKKDLLVRIAQQTTDCCYFLQSYAKKRFGKHTYNQLCRVLSI